MIDECGQRFAQVLFGRITGSDLVGQVTGSKVAGHMYCVCVILSQPRFNHCPRTRLPEFWG